MNLYAPIIAVLAIAAAFVAVSVVTSVLVGPKRWNRAKYAAYECGIQPTPEAKGGGRVPLKYFMTAMMFIIFDIEIVFLYPWAVTFDVLPAFTVGAMILFLVLICLPYAYELRRGGLEWD